MFRLALLTSVAAFFAAGCGPTASLDESRQATGVKVGEVSPNSAIVWTRVTEREQRRSDGIVRRGRANRDLREDLDPLDLEGSVPGAPGRVRIVYGESQDLTGAAETEWLDARPEADYTRHFRLTGLKPDTVYYFESQTSSPSGDVLHQPLRGRFKTAPPPDVYARTAFTVVTGQAYRDTVDAKGFEIYRTMLDVEPDFLVPTGDSVYYDSDDPLVTNIDLARYHWHRMYSMPTLIEFHRQVPVYFLKDDHDSYANDNWPGLVRDYMGTFSFEQGLQVYAEQVPMSDKPYRTFRWGKGLQIWLVEGRDFRSPNDMPDGPEKTIWGEEQKQWLTQTLLESEADFRVLISPTPIVGPDRENKADNHANEGFTHEGNWFRNWAAENLGDNFFIACGDRHWQYHSVDPVTGLHEFSSGPITDAHAGGSPGEDGEYHRFHRVKGGFLSVTVEPRDSQTEIAFRFHSEDGNQVYEWKRTRKAKP